MFQIYETGVASALALLAIYCYNGHSEENLLEHETPAASANSGSSMRKLVKQWRGKGTDYSGTGGGKAGGTGAKA